MQSTQETIRQEICHKAFNLNKTDNLHKIPCAPGVYGLFALIDEQPTNCRVIAQSENLQLTMKELFEHPKSDGIKRFMQGPWVKILQYALLPDASEVERIKLVSKWEEKYMPKIDENGVYPDYY